MDLYRNNTGVSYPYTLAGFVSITGSSTGATRYYFLYDWEIVGQPCLSSLEPVEAKINPFPTPSITPSGTQFICSGDSIMLTASGGDTYLWSNGATGATTWVLDTGSYDVVATDSLGCIGSAPSA